MRGQLHCGTLRAMSEIRNDNFGVIIAYLLPGMIALWGISILSDTVRSWFGATSESAATVGGFLHVTLASLAAGLLIGALRWGIVDSIHHRTGVRKPDWNFRQMRREFHVFEGLVENHYRYYQFFGGTLISTIILYATARFDAVGLPPFPGWPELLFVFAMVLLFVSSRDTLRKYYDRVSQLASAESISDNRR